MREPWSLVDDMFTEDGKVVIENTVRMMQGIHKKTGDRGRRDKGGGGSPGQSGLRLHPGVLLFQTAVSRGLCAVYGS